MKMFITPKLRINTAGKAAKGSTGYCRTFRHRRRLPSHHCLLPIACCLLFSLLSAHKASAQTFIHRYINKLINDTTDIREPQFLAYPTLAYSPETSWEIGISSLFVYYAKKDTTNRLSELNGFVFYTLNKQYGGFFEHALYTHQNRYSFIGKLKYSNFPLLYYGVGPNTPSEHAATVNARLIGLRERALRKVGKHIFTGIELDFQRLSKVEFEPHGSTLVALPPGSQGSSNLGFGTGILYDERHNVLNVRKGAFAELAMLHYDKAWGSDYSFTTIISDNRLYKPLSSRNVLAAQAFGQFSIGQPPFNQLALLGGESLMRGYYSGRYRDRNLVAAQVEFRMLPLKLGFSKRFGAALFAGASTVFNRFSTFSMKDFVWAGGGGLRFLLFPKKDIFSRIDVAFTREGKGVYLFIGEAF